MLSEVIDNGGEQSEWENSEESRNMLIEAYAKDKQRNLCNKQAERLSTSSHDEASSLRRSYIRLFTTSKLGLGILGTGAGKRGSRTQSTFRKQLIEYYDSVDPEHAKRRLLWCPIIGDWVESVNLYAAHIFGYMNGQETMTASFGPTEEAELWSPRNGLLISGTAEENFERGLYVIVPDIPENASVDEVSSWNMSEPKEYKIKIIDPTHPRIDSTVDRKTGSTWRELDNVRLRFRNDHRPRARYLYYHYCTQILRRAWNMDVQGEILKDELKKHFWGTPGKYVRQNMLRAFVEELGHEYERILDGAADNDGDEVESDPSLLSAAINQIESSTQNPEDSDEEDTDEDDDDRL